MTPDFQDKPQRPRPRRSVKLEARAEGSRGGGGDLFIWTIIILLLIGFAFACWIGSFYIFGHPEKAVSYSILTKLKKLEPIKRFELTAAPRGEFLTADQLLERYQKMTPRELDRASEELTRNFLRNFKLSKTLVPYVVGNFNILDSYELKDDNFVTSGVVALAQSTENPTVLLEHIFSADSKVVPTLHRMLLTGLDLRLVRRLDLSALINVKRLKDGRLQFTAIPIVYGSYASNTGPGSFSLEPPEHLNVGAGLPIVTATEVDDATQKYTSYLRRNQTPGKAVDPEEEARRASHQLVRVERPEAVNTPEQPPAPAPTPELAQPTPPPIAQATPAVQETPPPPLATPSPTPVAQATPTPSSIATTAGGAWPTYAPGQMPRGRLLAVKDMPELSAKGVGGERMYLSGNFVVTASGQNRAVLRSQGAITETLGIGGRTSNVRVIVDFPSGSKPPADGATFNRDAQRPFLITDIRKTANGEVNVYVREVTKP